MARIAYLRVSTTTQKLDRQEDITAGADKVFREKISGKDRERPELKNLIEWIREGDQVIVWSIDRLARSLRDLETIIGQVTDKGARITFVKEQMTFSAGDSDPYQKIILQMLGAFAEFERNLNLLRQREGIDKIRAAGRNYHKKPRKRKLSPEQVTQICGDYTQTRKPVAQIAREQRR